MGYRGIHELRLEHPTCVEQQDVAPVDALLPQGYRTCGTTTTSRLLMDIGGVIFDVDGLMADSEPLHRAAWHELGRQCGFPTYLTDAAESLASA